MKGALGEWVSDYSSTATATSGVILRIQNLRSAQRYYDFPVDDILTQVVENIRELGN